MENIFQNFQKSTHEKIFTAYIRLKYQVKAVEMLYYILVINACIHY